MGAGPVLATGTGTGFSLQVHAVAVQSDGKIIVGGNFTTLDGATANRIARLNADGTPDTTFTTGTGTGFDRGVYAVAVQSDGKIIVGGEFRNLNGTTATRIARLNADGTPDTTFTSKTGTGFNSEVYAVAVQSDGKIIAGGFFTTLNGVTGLRPTENRKLDGSISSLTTTLSSRVGKIKPLGYRDLPVVFCAELRADE